MVKPGFNIGLPPTPRELCCTPRKPKLNKGITLFHWPNSRSVRCLWFLNELKIAYPETSRLRCGPCSRAFKFKVYTMTEDFRTNKPDWYIELNPNRRKNCRTSFVIVTGRDGSSVTFNFRMERSPSSWTAI